MLGMDFELSNDATLSPSLAGSAVIRSEKLMDLDEFEKILYMTNRPIIASMTTWIFGNPLVGRAFNMTTANICWKCK